MRRGSPNPKLEPIIPYQFPRVYPGESLSKKPFQIRLRKKDHEALMAIPQKERLALVREAIGSALAQRQVGGQGDWIGSTIHSIP